MPVIHLLMINLKLLYKTHIILKLLMEKKSSITKVLVLELLWGPVHKLMPPFEIP